MGFNQIINFTKADAQPEIKKFYYKLKGNS